MIDQPIATPPTPPSSNDIPTFRERFDAFVAWIVVFTTQIIGLISQINSTAATINEKEASAVNASLSSQASANFKGVWNGTTLFKNGESVFHGGIFYRAIQDSTGQTPPTIAEDYQNSYWVGFGASLDLVNKKADEVYVESSLLLKADKSDTYTKSEVDNRSNGVRQTVRYASTDQATGLPNFVTAGTGLSANISATAKNVKFHCAGGDVDKEGKITADTIITGLSASAINYLYADINATSGAVTLGSTTIAPEYQKGLLSTDFPTWDTVNKGSGVTLSNGNLTATKTVATSWVNANVYASKLVKGGKFYAEVTVGSVLGSTYLLIGVSTINSYQSYYFADTTTGYSYLPDGTKLANGVATSYGATYTTGDKIGVLYDYPTGQLTFYKNGVSQGVAYTLTANTPVYLAVAQYSTGNVTVNYGASSFVYPLPSGAVAWNAERITGRHIFDIAAMEMWLSNGTAYDKKYRVFFAEVTTDATTVTSVVNYALNGKCIKKISCPARGIFTAFSHNIGVLPKCDIVPVCRVPEGGYNVGETCMNTYSYISGGTYQGFSPSLSKTNVVFGNDYINAQNKGSIASFTLTPTNWDIEFKLERGF